MAKALTWQITFRSCDPAGIDRDMLHIATAISGWSRKTLTLAHERRAGEALAATGREIRCVFRNSGDGSATGDGSALRAIMEERDV